MKHYISTNLFILLAICSFGQRTKLGVAAATPPSFTLTDGSGREGTDTHVAFAIAKTGTRTNDSSYVQLTVSSGSATLGDDFADTTITVGFHKNEYYKVVEVRINDDGAEENAEYFNAILDDISNARIARGNAVGFILDNDESIPPPPDPELPYSTFEVTGTDSATVSMGVYRGDYKIRDLFSHQRYDTGTHPIYWDGTDDTGAVVTDTAGLSFKWVQHRMPPPQWEGTALNTSSQLYNTVDGGDERHEAYYAAYPNVVQVGEWVYAVPGYSEGNPMIVRFNINTPQKRELVNLSATATLGRGNWFYTHYLTTDGEKVYFSGFVSGYSSPTTPQYHNTALYAVDITSNTLYRFSTTHLDTANRAASFTNPKFTSSKFPAGTLAGLITGSNADYKNGRYTGIAVNRTYIFASLELMGKVAVVNKRNGQTVHMLNGFTSPKKMWVDSLDGVYGSLWLLEGTSTIKKYTIQSSGSLVYSGVSITGLQDAKGIGGIPGSGIVGVTDGGTSHQLKKFNTTTGAFLSSFGTAGGHTATAVCATNTFYFDLGLPTADNQGGAGYYPLADGSYWLCNVGDNQVLKFNSSDAVTTRVEFQGATYFMNLVEGDSTRLLVDLREYQIDYAKSVQEGWTLTHNYAASVDIPIDRYRFFQVVKMSNGRTYGITRTDDAFSASGLSGAYNMAVFELTDAGLRNTGIYLKDINWKILPDGTLVKGGGSAKTELLVYAYTLTGFDGSNNPVWSVTPKTVGRVETGTAGVNGGSVATRGTSGLLYFFDANGAGSSTNIYNKGYHVGATRWDDVNGHVRQNWIWRAGYATFEDYRGKYPDDNRFEIGNGTNYPGSMAYAIDRFLLWGHHGEFWKNSQTNMFHLLWDNGLQVLLFGEVGAPPKSKGYPGMAGNALTFAATRIGNTLYLWNGDENKHNGAHRWKITGLETIIEGQVRAKVYAEPTEWTDLMASLTRQKPFTNHGGWVKTTAAPTGYQWQSGAHEYRTVDLWIQGGALNATGDGYRYDLGTLSTTDWAIKGFSQRGNNYPTATRGYYIQVKDAAGKVICRVRPEWNNVNTNATTAKYIANAGSTFATLNPVTAGEVTGSPHEWHFSASGGAITISFAGYSTSVGVMESGADWTAPKTVELVTFNYNTSGNLYGFEVSISQVKFRAAIPN